MKLTLLFFTIFLTSATAAPLGSAFAYHGQLTDNGTTADGDYDLRFTLYDEDTTGLQIGGLLEFGDVPVSSGTFAVELDFGGGAFDGEARWLEIAVRDGVSAGSFTTLMPRQRVSAVPYALVALTATTAATSADGWTRGGNAGTNPENDFIGTTDEQPLEFRVSSLRALRIEPTKDSFGRRTTNTIQGSSANFVENGVGGATISGGGVEEFPNGVTSDYGTVGGGVANQANGIRSTVSGGANNWAGGSSSTISGGAENSASSTHSTVSGGENNHALKVYSTVGGGLNNQIGGTELIGHLGLILDGTYGTVGGGKNNKIQGDYGTVGGGENNVAEGFYATIPGGRNNSAVSYAFAAGRGAIARHRGSFVWGDAHHVAVNSERDNQFVARASGGVKFFSNTALSTGVQLGAGGGAWSSISDRDKKRNLREVDGKEILGKLLQVPISQWSYKSQDPGIEHIGPMAQDFYAAYGLGEDDKHISTLDPDGVALASIKGLHETMQEENSLLMNELDLKDRKIAALQQQISEHETRLNALERLITQK